MNEGGFSLTPEAVLELQNAMSKGGKERFDLRVGAVYIGEFRKDWFQPPDPHYGVMHKEQGAVYTFAPITSEKNNRPWVVMLEAGTLPPRKKGHKPVRSYVLVQIDIKLQY